MDEEQLARALATGLIELGLEGGFGSVSRSTAGDYPSLGVSQWEGPRAEALLRSIPGGEHFTALSYSALAAAGRLEVLSALLSSPAGRAAQEALLSEDARRYIAGLSGLLENPACLLYAGLWSPTSEAVVRRFLENRKSRGIDCLENLHRLFYEEYARAADAEAYAEGYRNRAKRTYEYVKKQISK